MFISIHFIYKYSLREREKERGNLVPKSQKAHFDLSSCIYIFVCACSRVCVYTLKICFNLSMYGRLREMPVIFA